MEKKWDVTNIRERLETMVESVCKIVFSIDSLLAKVKALYDAFAPELHYRRPEILAPLVAYFDLKKKGVDISDAVMVGISELETRDLHTFKLQMQSFINKGCIASCNKDSTLVGPFS